MRRTPTAGNTGLSEKLGEAIDTGRLKYGCWIPLTDDCDPVESERFRSAAADAIAGQAGVAEERVKIEVDHDFDYAITVFGSDAEDAETIATRIANSFIETAGEGRSVRAGEEHPGLTVRTNCLPTKFTMKQACHIFVCRGVQLQISMARLRRAVDDALDRGHNAARGRRPNALVTKRFLELYGFEQLSRTPRRVMKRRPPTHPPPVHLLQRAGNQTEEAEVMRARVDETKQFATAAQKMLEEAKRFQLTEYPYRLSGGILQRSSLDHHVAQTQKNLDGLKDMLSVLQRKTLVMTPVLRRKTLVTTPAC